MNVYQGHCHTFMLASANDNDPPSCFIVNNLLYAVCVNSKVLSLIVSTDIREHIILLLHRTYELCLAGLQGVTKYFLLGVNEQ